MESIYKILPKDTKYIIFDFDGTLAQTHHIWIEVNKVLFKRLQINDSADEFDKVSKHMSLNQCSETILKRNPELTKTVEEINQMWYECVDDAIRQSQFVHGADDFIKLCHAQGIKMGIATTSPVQYAEKFFSSKDAIFKELFHPQSISSCDDIKVYKPDTLVYKDCLQKLAPGKNDFSECVIFEDALPSLKGASTLRKEGCYVICISETDDDMEEKHAHADLVIKNFKL